MDQLSCIEDAERDAVRLDLNQRLGKARDLLLTAFGSNSAIDMLRDSYRHEDEYIAEIQAAKDTAKITGNYIRQAMSLLQGI